MFNRDGCLKYSEPRRINLEINVSAKKSLPLRQYPEDDSGHEELMLDIHDFSRSLVLICSSSCGTICWSKSSIVSNRAGLHCPRISINVERNYPTSIARSAMRLSCVY
jgi:hypothetical protein